MVGAEILSIVAAISLSRPTMPVEEKEAYARIVSAESSRLGVNPFTVVALVEHESKWQPGAISADKEDFGLGQIRARWLPGCKEDVDPVNDPSEACSKVHANLLSGPFNLYAVFRQVKSWRGLCKAKIGVDGDEAWLQGYGGYSRPARGQWCGFRGIASLEDGTVLWESQSQPVFVTWVLDRKRELEGRFGLVARAP